MEEKKEKERFFSVELGSKSDLKNVSLANGGYGENVLVEGTIGGLRTARFAEGVVLEVVGSRGVLRINVAENEIGRKEVNK
jgi:hypothetical protein